jgi:hypothetical protein
LSIDDVNLPPRVNLGNASNANPPNNGVALTFNTEVGDNGGTGIDGGGNTYSLNALRSITGSASLVTWNSQDFNLGPATVDDAVTAAGQTIPLPEGYFTSVQLLGTGVNGAQSGMTFTVNYVGGGTTVLTQTFSDWKTGYTGGGTTAPGESIAVRMTSDNSPTGNQGGNTYLYGYVISTTSTKLISSITFPNNADVKILAIDEINSAQQNDPEDGVIEGEDLVAGSERPGGHVVTRKSPPPALKPVFSGLASAGDDLVAAALNEIVTSPPRPAASGVLAVAIGPIWAGQLGDDGGGASAMGGPFGLPVSLSPHPRGRFSWRV